MADGIHEKLINVQSKLKAPKNQYNNFGKYPYRNCEDILEALKPLLKEEGLTLVLTDDIDVKENGRTYVKAKASLFDGTSELSVYGYAREPESKKGMDDSQVTGASSSYARKYALNGLFLIDDTKDADSMDNTAGGATKSQKTPTKQTKAKEATPKEVTPKEVTQKEVTPKTLSDGIKKQAGDMVKRWCELNNSDLKKTADGIKNRPNYSDTKEFWMSIYEEFKKDIDSKMEEDF